MKEYNTDEIGRTALDNFTTAELVNELVGREGVQHIEVEPYVPIKVEIYGKSVQCDIDSGPCHIFVVYD